MIIKRGVHMSFSHASPTKSITSLHYIFSYSFLRYNPPSFTMIKKDKNEILQEGEKLNELKQWQITPNAIK